MPGTADIIKLIHRDEVTHTRLYQELILEAKRQYPESEVWDDVPWMFDNAVENEINWTTHVTQNQILGITPISTEQYTNYLASIRLKAIGYKVSENVVNPYKHLDRFSDVSSEATTKANFFETGVTSYQMSSVVSKWDF
jgi:ribonucleoside-diphosphate reductase beta chain